MTKFICSLLLCILFSCAVQPKEVENPRHNISFVETKLNENKVNEFNRLFNYYRNEIDESIKDKNGVYLFYNSMCYMCGIHDELFYFTSNNTIVRYCYAKYGEKKCSYFEGDSMIINKALNVDYNNYPLVVADWGKYQSDFKYAYIYTLNRNNNHEKINLFFRLDRCIDIKCESKEDYAYVPPEYNVNVFMHDFTKLYLKAEMNFKEGHISQELRNTFVSLFLKKYSTA